MLREALEVAILFTWYNCCRECHSEEKCLPFESWKDRSYEEIETAMDNAACGDYWFPLEVPWGGDLDIKLQFLDIVNPKYKQGGGQ